MCVFSLWGGLQFRDDSHGLSAQERLMFNKTRKIPNKVYPVQSIWILGRNENQGKARGNRIQPRLQPGWIDFSPPRLKASA
jgi:hypothetical protein